MEVFKSPTDAAGLEIIRGPMPFRIERISADIPNGFYGTVRLLVLRVAPNTSTKASQYTWSEFEPSATASHL